MKCMQTGSGQLFRRISAHSNGCAYSNVSNCGRGFVYFLFLSLSLSLSPSLFRVSRFGCGLESEFDLSARSHRCQNVFGSGRGSSRFA